MSTVGERIKDQRLRNKFTLQDVANRLRVTRTTIFKYENGEIKNVPLDTLKVLAKVLGCSVQYLSGLEETPNEDRELLTISEICKRLTLSERREIIRFLRYWYQQAS